MLLTYNAQFFPIFNSIIEPFYSLLVYVIVLFYVWVCTIFNTSNIIVVDEKICLKAKRLGYSVVSQFRILFVYCLLFTYGNGLNCALLN
jgi:hypothetical protein